ncbi:MAG TPA: hypothetical protein VNO79_16005 [Actinomycetota bacterium]|nr:hypothetical protein [Actinomycetota bacterium]
MSEAADALELMHTAVERWRTLRAAGRAWRHRDRARAAWGRWVSSLRRGRGRPVASLAGTEREPEPEETEERWRLWLAKPDRGRAEFEVGAETVTVVWVGGTWWSWSASEGVTTNVGDPHVTHGIGPGAALIDPAGILPAVDLELAGRSSFLGRPTVNVVARPVRVDDEHEEGDDPAVGTHGLGVGADEYRLVVDAERGVLLRSEAVLEGEPFRLLEVEEVAFDEDLPEGTFAPPAGEVDRVEVERWVPLEELPGAVPFQVFVPERPPFGPPQASVDPGRRRFGIPLHVRLEYHSPMPGEEDRSFWLVESGEPIEWWEGVEWREVGGVLLGEDRRVRPPRRLARLVRDGTHVAIEARGLGEEEVLELARSLVPLPPTPPTG